MEFPSDDAVLLAVRAVECRQLCRNQNDYGAHVSDIANALLQCPTDAHHKIREALDRLVAERRLFRMFGTLNTFTESEVR